MDKTILERKYNVEIEYEEDIAKYIITGYNVLEIAELGKILLSHELNFEFDKNIGIMMFKKELQIFIDIEKGVW